MIDLQTVSVSVSVSSSRVSTISLGECNENRRLFIFHDLYDSNKRLGIRWSRYYRRRRGWYISNVSNSTGDAFYLSFTVRPSLWSGDSDRALRCQMKAWESKFYASLTSTAGVTRDFLSGASNVWNKLLPLCAIVGVGQGWGEVDV